MSDTTGPSVVFEIACLRYMQTLTEIGADKNSTVVFPMPMDLIEVFKKRD